MLSCQRCKQTNNGPQAFLLTCRGCSKTWHHRCHMPPIEDDALIRRIRATNAGDTVNGLNTWMCRRCKKAFSETPSVISSHEQMVPSESREDRKGSVPNCSTAVTDISISVSTASVASTVDVRVKQESGTAVDARLLNKKKDRQESTEAPPAKRIFSAKRTKPSAVNQPHVQPQPDPAQPEDADVQMADATPVEFTPQEEKISQRSFSTALFYQGKSARKYVSTVPATSSEGDVEMQVEVSPPSFSEPTSRATSQALQVPSSHNQTVGPESVTEGAYTRAASSTDERVSEPRPADGSTVPPRVNQDTADEIDDDPEDLYGPFVERRIIRILPSLAEELKEQQRRVAAEKERRRGSSDPDRVYARHMHDPAEGRKRRKPTARKLGDHGLNVNELVGYFTVQSWVREHKP